MVKHSIKYVLAVVANGKQVLDDIGGLAVNVLGIDGRGNGIQHIGKELFGILQVRKSFEKIFEKNLRENHSRKIFEKIFEKNLREKSLKNIPAVGRYPAHDDQRLHYDGFPIFDSNEIKKYI